MRQCRMFRSPGVKDAKRVLQLDNYDSLVAKLSCVDARQRNAIKKLGPQNTNITKEN